MNKKINVITIILLFFVVVFGIIGKYTYDIIIIAQSIETYNEKHESDQIVFVGLVKVNRKTYSDGEQLFSFEPKIKLSFQGIYYVQLMTYYKYIKFYEDDTVITFTTNCDPEEVVKWKSDFLEGVPKGKYTIEEGKIQFTTIQTVVNGEEVRVNYSGSNKGSTLYLDSFSEKTHKQSNLAYYYYEE